MATIQLSIPDTIQEAFDEAFAEEDRDTVVARLMEEAANRRLDGKRRRTAIDGILALRRRQAPVSDEEIHEVRQALRS